MILGVLVDLEALLETVIAAMVAGIGVTLIFSFAILGAASSAEARRNGQRFQAAFFGALAGLALAATLAAIAVGVIVMAS